MIYPMWLEDLTFVHLRYHVNINITCKCYLISEKNLALHEHLCKTLCIIVKKVIGNKIYYIDTNTKISERSLSCLPIQHLNIICAKIVNDIKPKRFLGKTAFCPIENNLFHSPGLFSSWKAQKATALVSGSQAMHFRLK
jgi:hypothetical protein